jgi:hypothetical protein
MLASQSITQKAVVKSQTNFNILDSVHSHKPSLLAGVCYLFMAIFLASCSTLKIPGGKKNKQLVKSGYEEMSTEDYADHLASLKDAFLKTPGIKTYPLNSFSQKYLQSLTEEIISKNEIFFKNLKSANITILDSDAPLHFSLPKGEIFLSKGLISKYLKHESMLVSILAYELVRSENLLYPKQIVIPLGFVPMERMLLLNRLSLEEKMAVHKWAHYLTVRSGYDGEYYLSWLQTQNRNTADFILQVGDANLINREESLFKAFLIKNSSADDVAGKKNSSKIFYSFINSIRDQSL